MKFSSIVLTLSLLGNAALAAVFLSSSHSAGENGSSPAAGVAAASGATFGSASDAKSMAQSGAVKSTRPTLWSRLHHDDDLPALVARLRAAGFPPFVIRRVVGALITERFDGRRLALEKEYLESPFWANKQGGYSDPKIGPALLKLQVEQANAMKQLLGGTLSDIFADTEDARASLRQQIGDMAPEKLEKLYAFMIDYSEKRMQIYAAMAGGGTPLPADREKLTEINKGMRDGLQQFLSPTEADDILMRVSETGGRLRMMLGPFQPSEQEYRTIFPIYQAYVDQVPSAAMGGSAENLPMDQMIARKAAEESMYGQLKAALGDARAADIEQVMNPQYGQLNRLVSRLDLPISAARDVVTVQKDIQDRAMTIRNNGSLSGEERGNQITALGQEATQKITNILGDRGIDAYKQYGGQWLLNLAPRNPPPKK
jgi:hypothetical protein